MAETVQIVLGANTTGAINAIRNFTSMAAQATQGVQRFAVSLSQLGQNAATISSAVGNQSLSEGISKWTDFGAAVLIAGKNLVEVAKAAANVATKVGPRAGLWGVAAALVGKAGLEAYDIYSANREREESIKRVQDDNVKLQKLIMDAIELRTKAGAFTIAGANELFNRTAEAFNDNPNSTFQKLVKLQAEVTSGIGNRESTKSKLALNEIQSGRSSSAAQELSLLRERKELLRELQRTYPGGTSGSGGVDALQIPGPGSTEEELKNYKELLAVSKDIAETEGRISQIRADSNVFLNDLAATAAGSVQTAISGIADGITGIIMGTRTWSQAMQQTTASILSMVIQMILKFTVLYGLISLLQAVFPGSGFVSKFAGFAGFPGKASGGLVSSGLYQVGERGPEYVIDNKTLNRMGAGFFESVKSGVIPSVPGVPMVGGGGPGSGGVAPNVTIHIHQDRSAAVKALDNTEGHAFLASIMDGRIQMARA